MKSEEQIHYKLKEAQARSRELEERLIAAGWGQATWELQGKLDEYHHTIALLRWVLEG